MTPALALAPKFSNKLLLPKEHRLTHRRSSHTRTLSGKILTATLLTLKCCIAARPTSSRRSTKG